ncbi:MAG: amidohydrolase/deacetylase family metallohydrolase [Bryobacterales bacterium]|nr:amidohydrolase/deacetylase family metallohydrolase [Bryobacterales bacterium]
MRLLLSFLPVRQYAQEQMPQLRLLIIFLTCTTVWAQPRYDLLLKGGHVIDARNGIDAVRDVAIANGRIAAVAPDIPASQARRAVDVHSLYVTPGLVDMHVHVFAATMDREYTGEWAVRPDGFTFRSGVTTVVDAGCSGWRNFEEFKRLVIDRVQTRVLAMLNIVGKGMAGRADIEQDVTDMDPERTADMAKRHSDVVVGVKIAHYAGPDWGPVEKAVKAGTLANIPVMVDFATFRPERPFQDLVLKKLRPGDIYTHAYLTAVPMLDAQGQLLPYLFEARKRGIIFDVGHGGGSFSFRQAVPAIRQGFLADSISTDLHVSSMNAGMKDMLNLMSKFLAMGVSVQDVVARATWHPAREIHREQYGHLSVGAAADVAVLRLVQGDFGFVDSAHRRLRGTQKLICELTLKGGRPMWDLNGLTSDDWDKKAPERREAGR